MDAKHITKSEHKWLWSLRIALACALGLLSLAYMTAIVSGYVPKDRRLDLTSLAIFVAVVIGIALAINPHLLKQVKLLQMSGFKLEMLEQVRERQSEQAIQLQDLALMLPLLLPKGEREYLLKLASGSTHDQQGSHDARTALRRLRTFDLIRMKDGKRIGELKDGMRYDLARFFELTQNGQKWTARIAEIERGSVEAASLAGGTDE